MKIDYLTVYNSCHTPVASRLYALGTDKCINKQVINYISIFKLIYVYSLQ